MQQKDHYGSVHASRTHAQQKEKLILKTKQTEACKTAHTQRGTFLILDSELLKAVTGGMSGAMMRLNATTLI